MAIKQAVCPDNLDDTQFLKNFKTYMASTGTCDLRESTGPEVTPQNYDISSLTFRNVNFDNIRMTFDVEFNMLNNQFAVTENGDKIEASYRQIRIGERTSTFHKKLRENHPIFYEGVINQRMIVNQTIHAMAFQFGRRTAPLDLVFDSCTGTLTLVNPEFVCIVHSPSPDLDISLEQN